MSEARDNDSSFQYSRWLSSPPLGEEVVITGVSGRFASSDSIQEFRDNLFAKKDMVTSTRNRWKINHPEIQKRLGQINKLDKLDAGYFGLHHRQADSMDSMMKVFLERAIEAIMDAGVNPSELEGSKTGVFTGTCWSEIANITFRTTKEPQKFPVTGCLTSLMSHRLSYYLKLKGPAFNVDTACSSSSNALDSAFRAIRSGQCDNAIVGSVNLVTHPGTSLQFFRLGVLSYDGCCKVFDENADGYVRGEAVVCIFLQKAKYSRRIYAQIVNIKVNDDGYKNQGIAFPSRHTQAQLMTEIYEESGLHPNDLSYLEAHGTGTKVGDPEEVAAIDNAIARKRNKPLFIGSVKASVAHTEPVSGLCSLVKIIIAMEEGLIAPNINLNQVKKGLLGIEEGRMKVVTELSHLEKKDAIVGINSFGFGGNNAHVILKRFNKEQFEKSVPGNDIPRLVCVSGRTEEAVLRLLNTLRLDNEYIELLHQIYKTNVNGHLYRGHVIISKNGCSKISTKLFGFHQTALHVYFGQFQNNYRVVGSFLLNFPTFKNTILRINQLLFDKQIKSIETILQEEVNSNFDILASIAVQLGIVDIFKLLALKANAVYGDVWGRLVTEYYYNVYSLKEIIEKAINLLYVVNESNIVTPRKGVRSEDNFYFMENNKNFKFSENLHILRSRETLRLNISDSRLNNEDVLVVDGNANKFLETLGILYNKGHNIQLHKLYPEVIHPVSRGTPMISPVLDWDHNKSWHLGQTVDFTASGVQQINHTISSNIEEYKFITGHVVDDRNLFPASGYLNLVWETLARSLSLLKTDIAVVFENCKFFRPVTIPEGDLVKLLVTIQSGSGNFEMMEKDSLIFSGRIYVCSNISDKLTDLEPQTFKGRLMKQDEIYRELYLRGYSYSGPFKGISTCDTTFSTALIRWEGNWISFMDTMFQMKILQTDTRMLYFPLEMKQIILDPSKLLKKTPDSEEHEILIPVYSSKECDTIKCEGIEVRGFKTKLITRRKQRLEPVLEKYEFVPNQSLMELTQAIRINTQIIFENSLENTFEAVEFIDEFTKPDSEFLLPLVSKSLDDIPVVTSDLKISSKEIIENIPGIKNEDIILTSESNFLLIVGTKILQRPNLQTFLEALGPRGYILTREDMDFMGEHPELNILTQFTTSKEKLILLTKPENLPVCNVLKISSENFSWLPQLQKSWKHESNIMIYSQGQEPEGLLGLINCIRREPGGHKVRCFLISDEAPEFNRENPFYANQIKKNYAINVYKEGKWGTYRHLPLEEEKDVDCEHCYGNVTVRGDLSSIKWMEGFLTDETFLQKDQILVSTYYSALNFQDVMIASGRISLDSVTTNRRQQLCAIGLEFSGKDCTGRRLMGMVNNRALSNYVVADDNLTWDIPESWTLEDAATVPVVYSTLIYALFFVTKLKTGSSILIHSATGGIGLAALNVCLYKKCNIFVTVGTEEKKEYLKKHYPHIPDSHIGNSRDTSFEAMIRSATRNRGVDIVLNSLSKDKLSASIRCLSNGGCFLEIGKYNIGNNTYLNLDLMKRGASYHGIMLDQIITGSSELKNKLRNAITDGIKAGYIKPLRRVLFSMDKLEASFRYMITGKHMGKVLIKIRNEDEKKDMPPQKSIFKGFPRFTCDSEKSYIIIGGLGGVGLELADWLILRGATKLVLVSRSGIRTGYQSQRIELWKSYGAHVEVNSKDVTSKTGCLGVIEDAQRLGSVDAVFNLAAVFKDASFEDQTEETFCNSLTPKAQTTLHLDKITRELCPGLRYFVVFSSVICGRGNAGQTNYGMANSVMERICERRKRDGFPALAIQWGAIGDVGLVANMQKENKELVVAGTAQQRVSSCFEVLERFLKQDYPVVSSILVAEKRSSIYSLGCAVDAVAAILGIKDMKTVSQQATLAKLGMDSMMGTEVIQLLEKKFEIYVTSKDIRSMTFAKLTEIESNRKTSVQQHKASKIQMGTNFVIQHLPIRATTPLPVVSLPSQVKDSEEAKKVFVLCGVEGAFQPLEVLTSKINAVVLGIPYNYDNPEDSVQEIARNFLPHIEPHLNQTQDFLIIGYSFGSVVSLEVAHLLEDKGYKGRIVIIDGSPTYLSASLQHYFSVENDAELQTTLVYKLLEMVAPFERITEYRDKLLLCADLSEKFDFMLSLLPDDLAGKEKLEKRAAFFLYKHMTALRDYKFVHKKFKSKVYLFKAKYPLIHDEDDYQLSKVCDQEVVVTTIDGDHATILNQDKLAYYVNKYI